MDEFALIDRFVRHFAGSGRAVAAGPGDDCAVLRPSPGQALCVTTDAVVEGVHFYFPGFSAEDVGHKALAVNLSDLAAAGAAPRWFVCALAAPRSTPVTRFDGVARGMAAIARRHRIALVGGNFTGASELSITITAAGEVPRGRALGRGGARPGDVVFVSGELGAARVGLLRLKAGDRRDPSLARQRRPEPRVALGILSRRFARAAIDISDGFFQDLSHLLVRSRVGAEIDLGRLPVAAAVARGRVPLWVALGGGEDYELVVCVPEQRAGAFARACRRSGERVTAVGRIVAGPELRVFERGRRVRVAVRGFRHF